MALPPSSALPANWMRPTSIHLTNYVRRYLSGDRPLVLDLSQLDFLAAQGIKCLFEIADECDRNGIEWALVPGHPVLAVAADL